MAADKKAIDFGKIKRYIKNRTAEFYLESLDAEDKESFQSQIEYLNNVRRTKDLAEEYTGEEIERIKNCLTEFSPTTKQKKLIDAVNRQKRDENTKFRRARAKRREDAVRNVDNRKPYEKVSEAFVVLKDLLEKDGKLLTSKEIEVVKKNLVILTHFVDATLQERFKFEIQQARRQAEEIKSRIDRLNSKIKP
jgi:hypothetical protein